MLKPRFIGRGLVRCATTLVLAAVLGSVLPRVCAGDPTPTPGAWESDPQGWTDLLPAADLKGWYRVSVPPTGTLGRAQWHVDTEQRMLICDGDGGHDMLLTDREYGDAVFHLEFRYTKIEGKTGYNSGAYVRNSQDGAIWHQAQFGDANGGFLFGETPKDGGGRQFFSLSKQVTNSRVKPAGEWNTLEITARGSRIALWMNGAVTCEFTGCQAPRGRLGVEGEGYRVEFRNLKVKELPSAGAAAAGGEWVPLFNGRDLDGWTPKIRGFELGDNHQNTFRVENGILRMAYDRYTQFDSKYGHLFYREKFSHYRLRAEYRFVGEQTAGGPGWAFRNSGLMLHCQAPETMRKDQDFPVSIEVQLLGGDGRAPRTTANLCTPGTHVVYKGKLHTPHCTDSSSKTYPGDQWVTAEIEVRGDRVIRHFVNGEPVLEYEQPQLDPGDADAKTLIEQRGGQKLLSEGWISLQAESHPVEYRKVEIMRLAP